MKFNNLPVLLAVSFLPILFINQSAAANSCSGVFSDEPGNTSSNKKVVIMANFAQRRSAPSAGESNRQTQELNSASVLDFKIPTLKFNESPDARMDKIAAEVVEYVSRYQDFVQSLSNSSGLKSLSQSDVWKLHSEYTNLSSTLERLADPKWGYNKKAHDEMQKKYSELKSFLDESNFFNNLERMGHSLVPRANEVAKSPLPPDFREIQSLLAFNIQAVRMTLGSLSKVDSIRGSALRQRLLNGDDRKQTFTAVTGFLSDLNAYLSKVRDEIKIATTDINPVLGLIETTETTLSHSALERARGFGLESPFPGTRELVHRMDQEIAQFKIMAHSVKNSDKNRLRLADAKNEIILSDADVYKFVENLKSVFEHNKADSDGDFIVELQTILSGFFNRIDSAQDLNLSEPAKQYFNESLDWLRDTAKRKSSMLSGHNADQINAVSEIHRDVALLKELLR